MADFSANVPVTISNTTGTVGAVITGALTGVTSTVQIPFNPTSVAAGGTINANLLAVGFVTPGTLLYSTSTMNVVTGTILATTGSAGNYLFITDLTISCSTANNVTVIFGTSTQGPYFFGNYGGMVANWVTPLRTVLNGTIYATTTAGTTLITILGYQDN